MHIVQKVFDPPTPLSNLKSTSDMVGGGQGESILGDLGSLGGQKMVKMGRRRLWMLPNTTHCMLFLISSLDHEVCPVIFFP